MTKAIINDTAEIILDDGALSERPSDINRRVAEARAKFKSIRLPYPRQDELVAALDELRLTCLMTKGQPQEGVRLIAQTGSGKTEGAKRFQAYVAETGGYDPLSQPVVIATIDGSGTTRSVPVCILKALGVPRPEKGTEPVLWMRAVDELRRAETQILIIDEFNRAARRPTMSSAIATVLRDLMDQGIVALAFLGTEEARDLFKRNPDLGGRLDAPVAMEPLDWLIEEDRYLFVDFLAGLDEQMVVHGILPDLSNLADPELARTLCEAANGNIRQISRIVRTAMAAVVRRNGYSIDREDLEIAVDDWSIPNGCISYNPFRAN